ncbi:MAG: ACP S-malonyltransferase [Elusimicrobia bacterium]|nr:ACP S-malonyltransferase [Elusimicrobiota bacterium]
MGKALYEAVPSVRRALDSLPREAAPGLKEVMFSGPGEKLFPPVDSPCPSLFFEVTVALSLSVARALRAEGAVPGCAAGRSVGEFAAYAFAGAVPAGFCFSAIREFSRLGQKNCLERPSLLLTVYGADRALLRSACSRLSGSGRVCELVNFYSRLNAGVVGLDAGAAAEFRALLPRRTKVKTCREVGAFHTSLFSDTARSVAALAAKQTFSAPEFPLYCGSDGRRRSSPARLRREFSRAVDGPVLWEEVLGAMLKDGVRTFVELAPGAMLTEFICDLPPGAEVLRTDTPENFKRTLAKLTSR